MKIKYTQNLLTSLQIDVTEISEIADVLGKEGIYRPSFRIDDFTITYDKCKHPKPNTIACEFRRSMPSLSRDLKLIQCIVDVYICELYTDYSIHADGFIRASNTTDAHDPILMDAIYTYMASLIEHNQRIREMISRHVRMPESIHCMLPLDEGWLLSLTRSYCWTEDVRRIRKEYDLTFTKEPREESLNSKFNRVIQKFRERRSVI